MTSEYASQVTVGLLLLSLMSVLAIGLLATCLAFIHVRRGQSNPSQASREDSNHAATVSRYWPSLFEQTCRWAVVKTSHISAVQAALDLHNPIPCSWGDGLARLTSRKLFVSPPVRGWILIVGRGLPDPSADVDRCYVFVSKLSRALGHVQFFSLDRGLQHHAWVQAQDGQIRRGYAWGGATLWNQGSITEAELELGMKCYDYAEFPNTQDLAGDSNAKSNVDKMIALASRWSFDPATVDETMLRVGLGVAGDVTGRRH